VELQSLSAVNIGLLPPALSPMHIDQGRLTVRRYYVTARRYFDRLTTRLFYVHSASVTYDGSLLIALAVRGYT